MGRALGKTPIVFLINPLMSSSSSPLTSWGISNFWKLHSGTICLCCWGEKCWRMSFFRFLAGCFSSVDSWFSAASFKEFPQQCFRDLVNCIFVYVLDSIFVSWSTRLKWNSLWSVLYKSEIDFFLFLCEKYIM